MKNIVLLPAVCVALAACAPGTDFVDETPSVRVAEASIAVLVGANAQLNGELYVGTPTGDVIIDAAELSFTSSDLGVVTVSAEGVLTGIAPGPAIIQATYLGEADVEKLDEENLRTLVNVVETDSSPALVRVTDPGGSEATTVPLTSGSMLQLNAEVQNVNGVAVSATVVWNSSDTGVATVDSTGLVTGVANGTATIVAEADGIQSRVVTVNVFDVDTSQRVGTFQGVRFYDVSGTATLAFNSSGDLELTLSEDFSSTNGPDLDVILSTTETVTGSSINLGNLQSIRGSQTYAVPASVSIDQFDFVIIDCVAFNARFGFAALGAL
ncbi:MAG: DM13 domain-containing protein [Myxococcota bacterium]